MTAPHASPEELACAHDFDFRIKVACFEDKPGQGSIEFSGSCKHCGVPVIFYGQRGASAPFPVVNPDRTELRAPVTFGYSPKFQPGPTMLLNGPEIVPVGGSFNG